MESYHQANSHFVDEEFALAIENYNAAAKELPDFDLLYSHRAAANIKLKKFTQALQDCNKALTINSQNEAAIYRKGVACFELEEFEMAKKAFEMGQKIRAEVGKDTTIVERMIRKCDAELCQEISNVAKAPTTAEAACSTAAATLPVAPRPIVPSKAKAPVVATRFEYYQSPETVTISVLAKDVDPKHAHVKIAADHLSVSIGWDNGARVESVIEKNLFDFVDTSKCRISVRKTKIEIILQKLETHNWHTLEYTGPARELPAAVTAAAAAATAAADKDSVSQAQAQEQEREDSETARPKAYSSARNWDAIGSEINKELEAEKPEGEAALQKLFQDIYKNADEETRRAMNKSFQTSGGTVLSTNWKEVKEKDYEEERQAPKGVEWRNWEGEKLKQVED